MAGEKIKRRSCNNYGTFAKKISGSYYFRIAPESYDETIIRAINNDNLHSEVMLTLHPQRWTDNKLRWVQEFIAQNLKNQVKRWMDPSLLWEVPQAVR